MFPVTMTFTVQNIDQLNAVMATLSGGAQMQVTAEVAAVKKSKPETVAAITEPAATPSTAAATAAPAPKVETSTAPAATSIMDKDALTAAVKNAIAKVGRDPVVALMQSYGVGRAGEVPAEKRVTFDAALLALVA